MPDFTNPQIAGAIIALVGVLLGIGSTCLVTYINKRFEDRRHLREIAIKTALAQWERDIDTGHRIGERLRKDVSIAPLDAYIVHMLNLAEAISDKRLTAANMAVELARIRQLSHTASKIAEKRPE